MLSGASCLTLPAMIPAPDTDFLLRIDTNEMIERERFTALLASIEEVLRRHRAGGPRAYLLVGAVRHGSVEIVLAVGGIAATVIMALPSFLVDLKQLARDRKAEPNGFALALADVMAFDGASRADFVYKDKTVTIKKSEVPFVQKIAFGHAIRSDRQQAIRPEELQSEEHETERPGHVEDEDQDWVPTLEAGDHPPREARAAPSGYFTSLTLLGQFERVRGGAGSELRFIPRDPTIAPSFLVTSNDYDSAPDEDTDYEVTGNISVEGDATATIEVLAIHPPQDDFLTLKT